MNKKKATGATITIPTLTGEELVQKVRELGNVSTKEKARQCGYSTETKNGVERANLMKFYNALIDAEGIHLDGKQNPNGRGGRVPSNKVTVQSNGNMLIGAAYTKRMGLKEGDAFEITLGRKHIRLRQIGSEDDDED
jgi:AbrB-like transcriptional regulator